MAEVKLDKVEVYYRVTVETGKGLKVYRVRDDGWALFVKTVNGASVGRVSFGTDSKRKPDADSALVALKSWLSGDMAGV
jgi:hypothetical protein